MRKPWPTDLIYSQRVLKVEQDHCEVCKRNLHVCDHRIHRVFTLQGPLELVCKLAHCPDSHCRAHSRTLSPMAEGQITQPRWTIGWDVFCWLGHRRFSRHWSIPQIGLELADAYQLTISEDTISRYLQRYQVMVAARQQDPARLAQAYREVDSLVLSIDGLQPEKGHETLYVVRELRGQRVWFAEALLSSTTEEIRRLVVLAKEWAQSLGKPVTMWVSDKQEAFVRTIAEEFPDVPHRYCQNHFLRDVAKGTLEADSHAKVAMRSKVRGLRSIEREVLAAARAEVPNAEVPNAQAPNTAPPPAPVPNTAKPSVHETAKTIDGPESVVLDYCSAVRGILNDDQGGPLSPPGVRMAAALMEVRESLQRNLEAKKGGLQKSNSSNWRGASTGGWSNRPRNWRRSVSKSRS